MIYIAVCVCVQLLGLIQLSATPWTTAPQAPLSMGFSKQEYWSGLPFPTPSNLPNPGMEPVSLKSPVLAGRFFITEPPWSTMVLLYRKIRISMNLEILMPRLWQKVKKN